MRAGSGYGPIRIRAELGTHGLDEVVIVQAFAALAEAGEDDWRRQARNLVRRRFGEDFTRDLALRRKAADFLLRRGFDDRKSVGEGKSGSVRLDLGGGGNI